MLRFEAGPEEVESLLKFLRRRAPQKRLLLAPLPDGTGKSRAKHRASVTALPLLRDLEEHREAQRWGIVFPTATSPSVLLGTADCLMQLFFSPADALGRRDVLLEVRDELEGEPPDFSPRSLLARGLGVRAIRRLRRRGSHQGTHWVLPP